MLAGRRSRPRRKGRILRYAFKRIPDFGNRVLRVVYNETVDPPVIVTVYFDRTKIEYDPTADALYVRLSEAAIIESEQVQPGVILDFDASGKVVGVEILSVSKRGDQPLKEAA